MPFFSRNVYVPQYNYGGLGGGTAVGTTDTIVQDTYQLITIGTILALTPQIGEDGFVTIDISPVITDLRDTVTSQDGNTTAPELDIKQASSMVRVRSGETIIMGGLIQNTSAKAVRSIPLLGDIPILGVLFQGRSNAKQKKELVIFLTPTIVR
jgi:type II secretory pathway component GspD/PulD (secretin)